MGNLTVVVHPYYLWEHRGFMPHKTGTSGGEVVIGTLERKGPREGKRESGRGGVVTHRGRGASRATQHDVGGSREREAGPPGRVTTQRPY